MKKLTLIIPFLLYVSCQVKSPSSELSQISDIIPNNWSATKQAAAGVDTQWLSHFKDATLNKIVAQGLKNNRSLKATAERLTQAQQRARLTGATAKPQLGVGMSSNRQQNRFLGLPGGGGASRFNSYGVSAEVSWEADLWGRVRAAQKADIATYESSAWMLRGMESSLAAQITKAWYTLSEARVQTQLAKEAVKIRENTRDAIAERFERALTTEGGTGAQYRVAESDVASARAEVARWTGQADQASRQLEILIGDYPSGLLQGAHRLPTLSKTPPVGLPSELLLRRPDILSAERTFTASLQRKQEAIRALFPSFALTASSGTATSSLKEILNSSFGVWSIGGTLSQAILTGGRLKTERTIRDSESKATLIELQDTVIRAFGEVETSLASERSLKSQLKETKDALKLAREASKAAQQDYQDGTTSIQTALNAESRIIDTASRVTTLQRLLIENRIDLHLALGGDYQPHTK